MVAEAKKDMKREKSNSANKIDVTKDEVKWEKFNQATKALSTLNMESMVITQKITNRTSAWIVARSGIPQRITDLSARKKLTFS